MGRPLREDFEGAIHHITNRGNRNDIIYLDDEDRRYFMSLFENVVEEFEWSCLTSCLMDTHFHSQIKTPKANLSVGMHKLETNYAKKFNRRHGLKGHLFQERFGDTLILNEEHLLEVSRYIVLNPVKERMVERPEDWPWSSYRATLGLEPPPKYLDVPELLCNFGRDLNQARIEYKSFVEGKLGRLK